jgi:hypothetical protein
MKIPNIFIPEKSLETKVNYLIEPGKVIEPPVNDGKRKILLYFKYAISLPEDGIYVRVRHPSSENGCFLEVHSESQFYAPHCPESHWSAFNDSKGKLKAYLVSDRAIFKYLKILVKKNNGILLWEDNEKLLEFKKRKDKYEDQYVV